MSVYPAIPDGASNPAALPRALLALEGLALGDAFGQCFFQPGLSPTTRELPPAPWYYTDDTQMSLSVVAILAEHRQIQQALLAQSLAEHYEYDRAYGPSMHRTLARIRSGEAWQTVAADAFSGQGSFGNGAAMRAAPLGAYFADNIEQTVAQAMLAAEVTHSHPEGIAGAVAVALAAAHACRYRSLGLVPEHSAFIPAIVADMPPSEVRSKLLRAEAMTSVSSLDFPASVLGNGNDMSAQDTVPYAIWCCAQALDDYQRALWLAVSIEGDRDTLAAIVGGVVACYVGLQGLPPHWLAQREPLTQWHLPR